MIHRALALAAGAATLAACTTTNPEAPVTRRADEVVIPAPSVAAVPGADALPEAPALPDLVRVPGPAKDAFLGRPVSDIEALLGRPALVRREGGTEFRRYDVSADCRAYVVALPNGGTVLSVETGAPIQGMPPPRFEDCTARETYVGS